MRNINTIKAKKINLKALNEYFDEKIHLNINEIISVLKNENVLILNNAKVASTFVNFYIGDGGHALDLSEVIPNQNYINSICDNVKEIMCLVKDPNKKLISSLHQIYMTSNTGLSDNAEHIKDKLTGE